MTELQSADAYCRYLTNRHYENFSVISLFLPSRARKHLTRIYAFCRTTDDLGDETGGRGSETQALQRLAAWEEQVRECFVARPVPIHPVLVALMPTITECRLSQRLLLDLIQANVQDQTVLSYESWPDLYRYCLLSAAPVGRMVLRVFDVEDSDAEQLSDDVCIGLQLANHAQDVRRDGLKGRSYLLQEKVRSRGTHAAVADLCDRANELLASGEALEQVVPARLRAQLRLYRFGGLEVTSAIRRVGYRTDQRRPVVSPSTKARLIFQALLTKSARIEDATPQRAA